MKLQILLGDPPGGKGIQFLRIIREAKRSGYTHVVWVSDYEEIKPEFLTVVTL